jgi:hypothetical protein
MQPKYRSALLRFLCSFLLTSCGTPPPPPKSLQLHAIIATQGPAQLNREGWSPDAWTAVAAGTLLGPNDLLNPDDAGSITVLCSDLSIVEVTARERPQCSSEPGLLSYGGAEFSSIRSPNDAAIPYILYPRNTLVLDPQPLLRWNATGASNYTVAVVADSRTIWEQDSVAGDQIRYPADAEPLVSGKDYLLVVTDNATGVSSRLDPEKGLGFSIVEQLMRDRIAAQEHIIQSASELDDTAKQLALAIYYTSLANTGQRGLWGEAWLLLEQVAATRGDPGVYQLLGDMLVEMKLKDEAQRAYTEARQRAQAFGDTATEAAAAASLWRLLGDEAAYTAAIEGYRSLGDKKAEEMLAKEHDS